MKKFITLITVTMLLVSMTSCNIFTEKSHITGYSRTSLDPTSVHVSDYWRDADGTIYNDKSYTITFDTIEDADRFVNKGKT